jgi:predicted RNase H-like HicB family nuclease
MNKELLLSSYIKAAMDAAEYDKLEDNTFSGTISGCPGVIAFGNTLSETSLELQSVLEDWIFVGIKFGHQIPVINGIDLNKELILEQIESL